MAHSIPHSAAKRLGCVHCFRTLNPNDSDESLRLAVEVNGKYYHQKCWEELPGHKLVARSFMPPLPPPLDVVTLVAEPLYMGSWNTLDDVPLGISESLVSLNSTHPVRVTLQNNSDSAIELDRHRMPLWAYVDYGAFDEIDGCKRLQPGEIIQISFYPHWVRPDLELYFLDFTESQGINLESRNSRIVPIVMLTWIYGFSFWHIITLFSWRFATFQSPHLFLSFFVLAALFAVLTLLMPAKTLWSVHRIVIWLIQSPVGSMLSPNLEQLKESILSQFRFTSVAASMHRWVFPLSFTLIGIGILGALLLWLFLLSLVAILPGFLWSLIRLIEVGAALYLLYLFSKMYGFDFVIFAKLLFRSGYSAYRAANTQ